MQSRLYRAPWHDGGLLLPGEIDERHAFARELVVLYIADDSDNLSRLGLVGSVSFGTQQKLLADGVLMGKVTAGGRVSYWNSPSRGTPCRAVQRSAPAGVGDSYTLAGRRGVPRTRCTAGGR